MSVAALEAAGRVEGGLASTAAEGADSFS